MTDFAVTWDYRCPFARNVHEHLVTGLQGGAGWNVRFVPFSLGQVHVAEGETDIWDRPQDDSGLLALRAGTVVRDDFPEQFLAVHAALFAIRHDQGRQLDEANIREALTDNGVDADAVFATIESGDALERVRIEHQEAAKTHNVWGVPTFIVGDESAFVRYMHRPEGDSEVAIEAIDRVVDLLGVAELNEFKHTKIRR